MAAAFISASISRDCYMRKAIVLLTLVITVVFPLTACTNSREDSSAALAARKASAQINTDNLMDIYFAGGCFWGVEEYFSRIPGVYDVTSGYANGYTKNPTYIEVSIMGTGHAETIHVQYDPDIVSLKMLTEQFFKIIDPISLNKQGNDIGVQYRSGVYYTNEADKAVIQSVFDAEQKKYTSQIVTELLPLENYYLAEQYHQDYLKKNPNGYCHVDFSTLDDL
jgi:peptide methionine sulfoxide reductase msrA/msrB